MKNVPLENASLKKKKKKNKVQKRWRMQVWKNSNASLEKKKTEFKSVGECKSGEKKKQSSKAQEKCYS